MDVQSINSFQKTIANLCGPENRKKRKQLKKKHQQDLEVSSHDSGSELSDSNDPINQSSILSKVNDATIPEFLEPSSESKVESKSDVLSQVLQKVGIQSKPTSSANPVGTVNPPLSQPKTIEPPVDTPEQSHKKINLLDQILSIFLLPFSLVQFLFNLFVQTPIHYSLNILFPKVQTTLVRIRHLIAQSGLETRISTFIRKVREFCESYSSPILEYLVFKPSTMHEEEPWTEVRRKKKSGGHHHHHQQLRHHGQKTVFEEKHSVPQSFLLSNTLVYFKTKFPILTKYIQDYQQKILDLPILQKSIQRFQSFHSHSLVQTTRKLLISSIFLSSLPALLILGFSIIMFTVTISTPLILPLLIFAYYFSPTTFNNIVRTLEIKYQDIKTSFNTKTQ